MKGRITVTDSSDGSVDSDIQIERFDDEELQASYRAEFTKDGGVAVYVDVYRGTEDLVTLPVAHFGLTRRPVSNNTEAEPRTPRGMMVR